VSASSGAEDEDGDAPGNSSAAYNHSIYLMVSVPYLALAVVGFLIYRGVHKNAAHLQARAQAQGTPLAATTAPPV
jgi:hypothetical protein